MRCIACTKAGNNSEMIYVVYIGLITVFFFLLRMWSLSQCASYYLKKKLDSQINHWRQHTYLSTSSANRIWRKAFASEKKYFHK